MLDETPESCRLELYPRLLIHELLPFLAWFWRDLFNAFRVGMRAMELDRMQRSTRVHHLAHRLCQALGPFGLTFVPEDQVLANLDQRVREPAHRAVAVERVALELSGIRNVVADLDAGNGLQALEQRQRQPRVLVPQHADRPGPRHALPRLGEAVHRQQDRRPPGSDRRLDRAIDR